MRTTFAIIALALAGTASAGNFSTKSYSKLEAVANKTGAVKAEAIELVEAKLNHTIAMADKVFEFKNITEKALNLSKFEGVVDEKIDEIVAALNVTAAKVADVKEGVEAKIEEPVKVVDDKIDTLRVELEAKLATLKNKTADFKVLDFPKLKV